MKTPNSESFLTLSHFSLNQKKKNGKCPIMGGMEGMNLPVPKEIN